MSGLPVGASAKRANGWRALDWPKSFVGAAIFQTRRLVARRGRRRAISTDGLAAAFDKPPASASVESAERTAGLGAVPLGPRHEILSNRPVSHRLNPTLSLCTSIVESDLRVVRKLPTRAALLTGCEAWRYASREAFQTPFLTVSQRSLG